MKNSIWSQLFYSFIVVFVAGVSIAASAKNVDPSLFLENALVGETEIVDCTLSGGTQTTCYKMTIAGAPADKGTSPEGPYCPKSIYSSDEEGGIWIDGEGTVYEVDGKFIENLSTLYNDKKWQMFDPKTGAVVVIDGARGCKVAGNPQPDPEFDNFCLECPLDEIGGGIQKTVLIPTNPVQASQTSAIRGRANIGVALNGVLLGPPAPLDMILSSYTLGVFDDCGAHTNPHEGYHYHAANGCSEVVAQADGHAPMIGYALDGYAIYAKTDKSTIEAVGLDECGGETDDIRGYHYHASAPGMNKIFSCFKGEKGYFVNSKGEKENSERPKKGKRPPPPGRGPKKVTQVGIADKSTLKDVTSSFGFIEKALAQNLQQGDCTLSNGDSAKCLNIVINAVPQTREPGPFCPPSITSSADEGGIWLDGENIYQVDGAFIKSLADLYGDDKWKLYNNDGTVKVTNTLEAFNAAARPNVAPEYQNHCVEGKAEWIDVADVAYVIPAKPIFVGTATKIKSKVGVTLDGVVIDPAAPVQAILGAYTIAAFDDCGGHFNPHTGYHMHGAVGCGEAGDALDGETKQFAIAMDGFPIHSAHKKGAESHDLDKCNGHETAELGYHYHAQSPEKNAVLNCLMGATVK